MPLLLHELVIGSGTSTASAAGVQKCPPHHVAIATVSHPGSAMQVTQLQQNRIVAISSSHARLNSDNSRLAEALAGNSPYSYPANSTMHIAPAIQVSYATPAYNTHTTSSSAKTTATYSSVQSPQRYNKGMAKQSYQLPFVLQDHNYGAPPPPVSCHSPPSIPHVTVSSLSAGYKVQHVNSNNSSKKLLAHHIRGGNDIVRRTAPGKQPRGRAGPPNVSLNMHNSGKVTAPISNSVPTHYIASLPLHRQQFMPHPKAPVFSSPVSMLSPSKTENPSSHNVMGADTDEESRLSDRGSSIGTSGEETETAPEGEGEDMLQPDDSITRCICDMTHDDGYMIQCDRCYVWQHVDCMQIDRNNIPDEYLCEACSPRRFDKIKAKNLQMRRMQEIKINLVRVSSSDSEDNSPINSKSRPMSNKSLERKVLKKKKPKVVKEVKIPKKIMPLRKNSTPAVSNNETVTNNTAPSNCELKEVKISKTRRRQSVTPSNDSADENVGQVKNGDLQNWVHDYEVAVTNHYSPELRAKIQSIRINGISPEFLESANSASLQNRCKVAPSHNLNTRLYESKILVASLDIKAGSAVAEYQGKYMLLSQWPSQTLPNWLHYMPYVVQYNMIKEGVDMCIDARTYGNNARFARKASKYNAKIRHIIKRGSVHLYLVACEDIKEGQEIVLSLESAVSLNLSFKGKKRLSSGNISQTDSAASTGDEQVNSSTDESPVVSPPRKNGSFQNKKAIKKPSSNVTLPMPMPIRQTRRTTSSSETFEELPMTPVSPTKPRRSSGNKSPTKAVAKSPTKVSKSSNSDSPKVNKTNDVPRVSRSSIADDLLKENVVVSPTPTPTPPPNPIVERAEDKNHDDHKLTREERKIAAIVKAFERMEKANQRRKDNQKKRFGDKRDDKTDQNSSIEDDDRYSTDDADEGLKRKKRSSSYTSSQLDIDSSPEQHKTSPESAPSSVNGPFRFPKTKKALMTEWLNETVDGPVLATNSVIGFETSGVKPCYMRSPSIPARRPSGPGSGNSTEVAGRSAKKRWLRQAIIDESEPISSAFVFCSSPNSRPDSPNGSGDYTTPLKKRRVARESMSSEHSNTPPSTPLHTTMDDDKIGLDQEMEQSLKCEYTEEDEKPDVKRLEKEIKVEAEDDQLTIDIGSLKEEIDLKPIVKKEVKECHHVEAKRPRKKKICKSNQKTKITSKQRYKKCKSKKKSKVLTSTVTKKVKNNKTVKKSKNTKVKNTDIKKKKGRKPANKCITPKGKVRNTISNSVPPENAVNLGSLTSPNEVLSVRRLTQDVPAQDESSSPANLNIDIGEKNDFEDSNMYEREEQPMTQESKPDSVKAVQIKRKLSILEYRKRKSVSCDADPSAKEEAQNPKKDSLSFDILSPNFKFDSPTPPHVKECTPIDAGQSTDETEMTTTDSPKEPFHEGRSPFSDDLSLSPTSPPIVPDNFVKEVRAGDKWNDAPTLLEQQRENLTARLRREFGLCIPDDKSKGRNAPTPGKITPSLGSNDVDSFLTNDEPQEMVGGPECNSDPLQNGESSGDVEDAPLGALCLPPNCDKS